MLKIQINNKDYEIPQNFSEMTLRHYEDIYFKLGLVSDEGEISEDERKKKTIEKQSIIISRILKENDWFALELPVDVYLLIVKEVQYLFTESHMPKTFSNELEIDGKTYCYNENDKISLRQWVDIDMTLKEEDNKSRLSDVLAILLTEKDKKYDGNYQELSRKIDNLSCDKALPLLNYFFLKGLQYNSSILISITAKEMADRLLQSLETSTRIISGT